MVTVDCSSMYQMVHRLGIGRTSPMVEDSMHKGRGTETQVVTNGPLSPPLGAKICSEERAEMNNDQFEKVEAAPASSPRWTRAAAARPRR